MPAKSAASTVKYRRVVLKLSGEVLRGKGTEPIEIEITEINSMLGNFAVRPPKLTLAPGGNGVLDPMISQLGVTSDEIPLTVTIRRGGKREQQGWLHGREINAHVHREARNR